MIYHKKPLIFFTLLCLSILITASCNLGTTGVWKNENIKADVKEQIHNNNTKLFDAIANKNITALKALLSDELIKKDASKMDTILNNVSGIVKEAGNYNTVLDEYYIKNSTDNLATTVPSGVSGNNDYVIKYMALNKETYISLFVIKGDINDILATVIYGKYDNDWKLNIIQFGQYSLLGKTTPDFYQLAQNAYKKSFLLDAVNYISLAQAYARPANDYFQYQKEDDMKAFQQKVMTEVNGKYKFPLTLKRVKTKPQVFRIYPEATKEGIFPMIQYLSNINLKDTVALKVEYNSIKKELVNVFPGINNDKNFAVYWAFNELPDGKKQVNHYGFIDKLK